MKSDSVQRKLATAAREKNKRYGRPDLIAGAPPLQYVNYLCYGPRGDTSSAVPTASIRWSSIDNVPLRILYKPLYPRPFADSDQSPVRRPSAMHQCARDDLDLPAKAANAPQLATNVDRAAHISPPTTGFQRAMIHQSPSAKRLGRMARDRFEAM